MISYSELMYDNLSLKKENILLKAKLDDLIEAAKEAFQLWEEWDDHCPDSQGSEYEVFKRLEATIAAAKWRLS